MNIVVLIKQVPDMEKVRFDSEKGIVDRASAGVEINPFDLNALEAAVSVAEANNGTVTAITMGPPRGKESLKEAVARGANSGILLSDKCFGGADTKATALTLAAAIKKIGNVDIIFAGEKTVDGDTGQVGAEVAEFLNIAHIYYVDEIVEVTDTYIKVVSDILEGRYEKKGQFPILATVTKDLNVPRIPQLKDKIRARKEIFPVWGIEELSEFISPEDVGIKGSPTKVKKIEVPKSSVRIGKKERENIDAFLDEIVEKLKSIKVLEA